jgi:pyrimidine deaminase RibD-like protein
MISFNQNQNRILAELMELHTDEIVATLARVGLDINLDLTPAEGYSEKTRKRAYWPRVQAAFREVPAEERDTFFNTLEDTLRRQQRTPRENNYAVSDEAADDKFARLAITEARKSVPENDDRPHPLVGAVVVKDGMVLAVAHRGELESNHAEYIALEKKLGATNIVGATVYTTLEPCTTRNHPKVPCADRLVERKVERVVIGMVDPDERISGRGIQRLRQANIATALFPRDLMAEVEDLNREFSRYCKQPKLANPKPAALISFYNYDGSANPIRFSGKEHSVRGPFFDLYSPVTIVNHTQAPTKIEYSRLVIGSNEWPVSSFFFRERQQRERFQRITVTGNTKAHYELHLLFPDDKYPQSEGGEMLFSLDTTIGPLVIKVEFS